MFQLLFLLWLIQPSTKDGFDRIEMEDAGYSDKEIEAHLSGEEYWPDEEEEDL